MSLDARRYTYNRTDPTIAVPPPPVTGGPSPPPSSTGGTGVAAPGSMYQGQPMSAEMARLSGLSEAEVTRLLEGVANDGQRAAIYDALRSAGNLHAGNYMERRLGGRHRLNSWTNYWQEANYGYLPVWDSRNNTFRTQQEQIYHTLGWGTPPPENNLSGPPPTPWEYNAATEPRIQREGPGVPPINVPPGSYAGPPALPTDRLVRDPSAPGYTAPTPVPTAPTPVPRISREGPVDQPYPATPSVAAPTPEGATAANPYAQPTRRGQSYRFQNPGWA